MISQSQFKILIVMYDWGGWKNYYELRRSIPGSEIHTLKKHMKDLLDKGMVSYGRIKPEGNLVRYGYTLTDKSLSIVGKFDGVVNGIRRRHGIKR